jgi:hypothetical protein
MFFSIVKWVLISLTLIFLVHHLYMFLMNTLTVPKIKDLVNKPNQQYKDLYSTMGGSAPQTPLNETRSPLNTIGGQGGSPLNTMGGQGGDPPLTDELSSFLSDLKKKNAPSAGPGSLGPGSLGPGSLGPNTDKFPSTLLGSPSGEMGYSMF